jgi:putative flippase GtrA
MNKFLEIVTYIFFSILRNNIYLFISALVCLPVFLLLDNFGLPELEAVILATICGLLAPFIFLKLLTFFSDKNKKNSK